MAILVAVAALMVALVAGTAAAKGGGGMKTFNFKGDAISENGSSISVEVTDGNRRGREAAEVVAADGEVRVQSKAPEGSSDGFVARKVTVEADED
jgi:hypothetical protein